MRAWARRRAVGIGGDPIVGTSFIDVLDALQPGPRDRGDRDDRRDRRRRGGEGGRLLRPRGAQADGRVHRRPNGTAGTPDGARRRDHLGRRRHRRVEARRARGGRRFASPTRPPTSRSCCATPAFGSARSAGGLPDRHETCGVSIIEHSALERPMSLRTPATARARTGLIILAERRAVSSARAARPSGTSSDASTAAEESTAASAACRW